ncbi:DUF3592 domain-containing protein [Thalassomonas sp. M1454]|uniref:DUF3592 domain-containing protein n=1 Tax=Thalassomonas sp. M1454 TaxID=2594477 RepID=UPI00163DC327|nr:DUF3592 domain-containing protein [Thalassomonas sp. M1454]
MEWNSWVFFSALFNLLVLIYIVGVILSFRAFFWDKVGGKIIKSEIHTYLDDGEMYEPQVEYEYKYNDEVYSNDRISFGSGGSNNIKSSAEYFVDRYCLGWDVTVYVNPKKPNKSILEPGVRLNHLAFLAILLFAIYLWVPIGGAIWRYLFSL